MAQQNPFQVAAQLEGAGQFRQARQLYRQLAGKHPGSAAVHAGIGRCSLALHELADAERAMSAAVRIEPRNPDHRSNLAYCLLNMGRVDDARAEARAALGIRPSHAVALRVVAETFRVTGEQQQAYDTLAPAMTWTKHDPLMRIYFAKLAAGVGRLEEAAEILRQTDRAAGLPQPVRSALHFELGAVLDKLKRYDEAWRSYETANRLHPAQYNIPALVGHVDAAIAAWTPERIASLPRAAATSDLPVYIIGMPRSGSSLLEQVLSGCPEIAPGGERADIPLAARDLLYPEGGLHADTATLVARIEAIRPASLDRLAGQIAKGLAGIDPNAQRVTDKHLLNFFHVPVIRMLFPGAPIIHIRRDPVDTCLSCYFQNFTTGMEFAYDLHNLALYYNEYARLMDHWNAVFPGGILELRYEDMVEDLESQARRVLKAIGIPWNDACLRFHEQRNIVTTVSAEQVRRPIYKSSVNRASAYEAYLGPLRAALRAE